MKRILTIALIATLCILAGYTAFELTGRAQRGRVYEELKESVAVTMRPTVGPTVSETAAPAATEQAEEAPKPAPEPTPEPYVSPIDFDRLRQIDPNIFAWIRIEGTNVDYPIVKHPTDDEYYLDHTIEGYAGYPGSIYCYGYTAKDFSQFNTIVYGHNMANGTMFADLNNYQKKSYMESRRTVKIFTPEAEYSYKIFAFLIYDDRLIDSYFDQRDMADRRAFLDSFYDAGSAKTYVLDDVKIDIQSGHLLTLATCHGVSDERTVVVAVRDDEA